MTISATSLELATTRLRGEEPREFRMLVVEDDVDLMNVVTRIAERLDPCIEYQPSGTFGMMSSMTLNELWEISTSHSFPFLRKPFTREECFGFLSGAIA